LRAACDDADDAIQAGALRILDSARLQGLDVVQLWLDEEERALAEGYNGLRIAGDTRSLAAGDWSTFMEYEHAVTERCNGRRIITLCSCDLAHCYDHQVSEVVHAHHCALERLDASWQVFVVPSFLALRAGGDLIESERNFKDGLQADHRVRADRENETQDAAGTGREHGPGR
jgi:hypothetical protein